MKKLKTMIVAGLTAGVLTAMTIPLQAASTNSVQNIAVALTLITQGTPVTTSNTIASTFTKTTYTTKDIISWLGTATTNSFDAKAKLVIVKHFSPTTNYTTIEIRDRTNAAVDVSAFFAGTSSTEKITESTHIIKTDLTTGMDVADLHLDMTNAAPYSLTAHFHINGLATTTWAAVKVPKSTTVLSVDSDSAKIMVGPGAGPNGTVGLMTGSVVISGSVTEIK